LTGPLLLVESNTTGTGRRFAQRARDLGVEPVLVTADPARYPYARLDGLRTEVADTFDEAAVCAVARRMGAAGITSSSEYFVASAAAAARAVGLSGPEPDVIRACRDKASQRRRLKAAGEPVPRFAAARDAESAVHEALGIGFPVVVKPVHGSGSVGVRLCTDAESTARQAAALTRGSADERGLNVSSEVLVEEYMPGAEYSVEVFGGVAVMVVAKYLGPPPAFVEIGHDLPAPVSGADAALLRDRAERAVAALGLRWGAVHVELRMCAGSARVVEVNPRLAGGMIPELVRRVAGIDLVAEQVRAALGMNRGAYPDRSGGAASIRFLVADRHGELGDDEALVRALAAAREVPGVVDVAFTASAAAAVAPAQDFLGRLGYVIAEAGTPAATAEAAERGLESLKKALGEAGS
jgi:biotin carboxylase